VRDVGLAEEIAQDALVAALEQWPQDGVPRNPGAWLTATAKHQAVDLVRREVRLGQKIVELGRDLEVRQAMDVRNLGAEADGADSDIDDDLLRLVFVACHPVLSTEARVALTLRVLAGLTTKEIARAFLVPEPTVAVQAAIAACHAQALAAADTDWAHIAALYVPREDRAVGRGGAEQGRRRRDGVRPRRGARAARSAGRGACPRALSPPARRPR